MNYKTKPLKENNINVTYSLSNENISYDNMNKTVVKSDDDELKYVPVYSKEIGQDWLICSGMN